MVSTYVVELPLLMDGNELEMRVQGFGLYAELLDVEQFKR
jgi:hypothetical protein